VADDVRGIAGPAGGRESAGAILRLAVLSAAAAFAITIGGGEWLGWTWTGFADNNTVWDWLQLLVLPVVLTAAPVWYRTRRSARVEWRLLLGAILLAFAILLLGGYELRWTWTGFEGRTLWDWLELLVLPITVTAFPIWLALGRGMHPRVRRLGIGVLAAFAVLVTSGYAFHWQWTGFPGNTLWDWLHLLLVPFVLPLVLAWFSARIEQAEEEARERGAAAAVSPETPAAAG
jgi:heme/copper-type cytochrome/quinol oxidase subunit 4